VSNPVSVQVSVQFSANCRRYASSTLFVPKQIALTAAQASGQKATSKHIHSAELNSLAMPPVGVQ
jgi:hypothetical protein